MQLSLKNLSVLSKKRFFGWIVKNEKDKSSKGIEKILITDPINPVDPAKNLYKSWAEEKKGRD